MQAFPPEQFVGVTGGSCSGKTTLGHNLAGVLGDRLALFPFDDMFVDAPTLGNPAVPDWEDPGFCRWDDFVAHMYDLKAGRPVAVRANSRESKEAGLTTRHISPRPIVVVAGFLALHHPAVNQLFDTTIYLDIPEDEIVRRRLASPRSGQPWDETSYITGGLLSGHRRVVEPQRAHAQHVIDATVTPVEVMRQVLDILALEQPLPAS